MNLALEAIPVPLRDDGHGGLRIGQTRASFESVWHLHQRARWAWVFRVAKRGCRHRRLGGILKPGSGVTADT